MEWPELAFAVARKLLAQDVEADRLQEIVGRALNFPLPLRPLGDETFVLELFHGPTLAFKDVGARFMAGLMAHYRGMEPELLTILTATSGDTGGAVAHAFLGLPHIRVVVLFPDGKVTPRQERQFSTLGRNIRALAVQGDFDDCQRMVKACFQDQALRDAMALTSANSINVGRLIPQTFYYFLAWARLQREEATGNSDVLFTVPSGNFGNLAAGLMAKAMGLPGIHFLAATNANDEVPEFLETGRFRPRPSRRTLSTAMDVGNPSNLDRILYLYHHDLNALRRDLTAWKVSDEDTLACIRRIRRERGYLLDPHSAVGFAAMERGLSHDEGSRGVLLATAHPAKFAEVVEPAVEEEIPVPPALAQCLGGKRVVTPLAPDPRELKAFLLEG
jgi:threonine synthase